MDLYIGGYGDDGIAMKVVTISEGADASGTIRIRADFVDGIRTLSEIRLTHASGATVRAIAFCSPDYGYMGGLIGAMFAIDTTYREGVFDMGFDLVSGSALLGTFGSEDLPISMGDWGSFSGKMTAGDAYFESIYAAGLMVSLNGCTEVSGIVTGLHYKLQEELGIHMTAPTPRMLLGGEAVVRYPRFVTDLKDAKEGHADRSDRGTLYFADVDVTVSGGALVTVGSEDLGLGGWVRIPSKTDIEVAMLISKDGKVFLGDIDGVSRTIGFFGVGCKEEYDLVLVAKIDSGPRDFATGKVRFVPTYSGNARSTAVEMWDEGIATTVDGQIRIEKGKAQISGESLKIRAGAISCDGMQRIWGGAFGFSKLSEDETSSDTAFACIYFAGKETSLLYYGGVRQDDNATVAGSNELSSRRGLSDFLMEGHVFDDSEQRGYSLWIDGIFRERIELKLGGAISVPWNARVASSMHLESEASLIIEDGSDGIVEYETEGSDEMPTYRLGSSLVAIYFKRQDGEHKIHCYASMRKALSMSDEIEVIGEYRLTRSITLGGESGVSVSIPVDASLIIGPGSMGRPVVVTVPENSKITVHGRYAVEYGAAIHMGSKGDRPVADVSSKTDRSEIFRDINTALYESEIGDEVVLVKGLQRAATVFRDASVKDGVGLILNGACLSIAEGVRVSIKGHVSGGGASKILMGLGSEIVVEAGGSLEFDGSELVVSKLSVRSGASACISVEAGEEETGGAAYEIDGVLSAHGGRSSSMRITGAIESDKPFIIGERLEFGSPADRISKIPDSAEARSRIVFSLSPGAIAVVHPSFEIGEDNFFGTVNRTDFMFGGRVLLAMYSCDGFLEFVKPAFLDFVFTGWYLDERMSHPVGKESLEMMPVGSLKEIYGLFEPKKVTLRLTYNPAVKWIVNGMLQGDSGEIYLNYGDRVRVDVEVVGGYHGDPVLILENAKYRPGSDIEADRDMSFSIIGLKKTETEPKRDSIVAPLLGVICVMLVVTGAMLVVILRK